MLPWPWVDPQVNLRTSSMLLLRITTTWVLPRDMLAWRLPMMDLPRPPCASQRGIIIIIIIAIRRIIVIITTIEGIMSKVREEIFR